MLGLQCGSFDMNAACAGFRLRARGGRVDGAAGIPARVAVGAETLSRIIDPQDRTTTVIFGDGAGAAVLAATKESPLACLGSRLRRLGRALLEIRAGGSACRQCGIDRERRPVPEDGGQEVTGARCAPSSIGHAPTLERASMDAAEVAWFVPHQANAASSKRG